ncbi:putative nuclease HARBI1 [Sitophilus oryzae]|uniref:Nuclease HARBI1 n=1 Tax=Sitophilus oryzae TaxID=7048 RepID=A0A6J2YSS6_SITOR|nr:putative nuclease HARBI1 [Sitophilus oryzae]
MRLREKELGLHHKEVKAKLEAEKNRADVEIAERKLSIQLLQSQNLRRAISSLNKLLLTLRFLPTGDLYIAIGGFISIRKTTAGRIIKQVVNALCSIFPQHVFLPRTEEEQMKAEIDFFMISRFPRVIGAMDCTHIKIKSPGGDNAEVYRNRK